MTTDATPGTTTTSTVIESFLEESCFEVAVNVTLPAPFGVTIPSAATVATELLEDDQVTSFEALSLTSTWAISLNGSVSSVIFETSFLILTETTSPLDSSSFCSSFALSPQGMSFFTPAGSSQEVKPNVEASKPNAISLNFFIKFSFLLRILYIFRFKLQQKKFNY